jgi:hypothetical protein
MVKNLDDCHVVKNDQGAPITEGPPLTLMALSLETTKNKYSGANEVIVASAFVCSQGKCPGSSKNEKNGIRTYDHFIL